MKSPKVTLLIIAMAVFAISCNNQANTEDHQNHQDHEAHDTHDNHEDHHTHSSHEKHESESGAIHLHNGEKWEVNAEMKPHILESQAILNEYIENDSDNYKALAEQLKEKNSALIKSCTMKGESHNELHKWLHPHMEMIASLDQAENADKAQVITSRLEKSFETYHQHFQ